ncbi:unnamed protein product [Pylaiella littoralis]
MTAPAATRAPVSDVPAVVRSGGGGGGGGSGGYDQQQQPWTNGSSGGDAGDGDGGGGGGGGGVRKGSPDSSSNVDSAVLDGAGSCRWVFPSGNNDINNNSNNMAQLSTQALSTTTTTTTSSTWGLPQQQPPSPGLEVGGGVPGVVTSSPTSSAESSPSTEDMAQMFTRPDSFQWLKQPSTSRRPTMNECQDINRLLLNEANFAAWTRVADDPDTLSLAKSIGDFLG